MRGGTKHLQTKGDFKTRGWIGVMERLGKKDHVRKRCMPTYRGCHIPGCSALQGTVDTAVIYPSLGNPALLPSEFPSGSYCDCFSNSEIG